MDFGDDDCRKNPPDEQNFLCNECGEERPIESMYGNTGTCMDCEKYANWRDNYFIEEDR